MIDENGVIIRNSSGKKVIRKVIVTPGGSFIEGEALVKKLKALSNYLTRHKERNDFERYRITTQFIKDCLLILEIHG